MSISNFKISRKFLWLTIIILFSIPAFSTLLQPGYFGMHDDLQIMRIYEMDLCFKDGQLPCRWIPDMGFGYGYPLFNFYPIMPYYLGELIHLLGFNLIWSVKIDFILAFLVSAISMFFLARKLWGNLGGFVSSMFYLYAPYHSVDVYVRGAMSETWSLAWVPAVFLMIIKVIEQASLKNVLLLAIFSALFLMSHNPLALIFTPIMGGWALIYLVKTRKWRSIKNLILAGVWGLGLAAFFTVPVLFEGKLVHLETLFIGYFNYLAHFISLNQMFISRFWGYGGSIWGPNDGMSFQIGWLHWGLLFITLPLSILLWQKEKLKSLILLYLFLTFWVSAFLMHPRSNPIWENVKILQTLQFPWRLLSITIFVSALSIGSLASLNVNKRLTFAFVISALIGVLLVYQPYFHIERVVPLTDQEKLSGALWDLQRTAGIFDYLPKTAKFPPGSGAKETIEVIYGVTTITNFHRGTNWLEAEVSSNDSATLRLPIVDFPTWKVFVDGKETAFDIKNDLGQPTFQTDPGNHKIYVKLFNTPIRTFANLISLVSFLGVLWTAFKLWKK